MTLRQAQGDIEVKNKMEEAIEIQEKRKSNTFRNVKRSVQSVLTGNFLVREKSIRLLPYFFFLSLLAVTYIANGYYAESKIRRQDKLTGDLKELKSEYITTKSDLMFISKQSEVAKAVEPLGLVQSLTPPKKILVRNNTTTKQVNDNVGD